MRSFPHNTLRERQREVFAAAEAEPVGITYHGRRNHVLIHGRLFGVFDWMLRFTAADLYRNASLVFQEANNAPVAIITRPRDLFVLVSADYYHKKRLPPDGSNLSLSAEH